MLQARLADELFPNGNHKNLHPSNSYKNKNKLKKNKKQKQKQKKTKAKNNTWCNQQLRLKNIIQPIIHDKNHLK